VAARESGVGAVFAEVFDGNGSLLRRLAIPLDELYSPKDVVAQDARYLRIYAGMQTARRRARIPPIAVIETDNIIGLTPILQVKLTL
jgi:hypothetical protein